MLQSIWNNLMERSIKPNWCFIIAVSLFLYQNFNDYTILINDSHDALQIHYMEQLLAVNVMAVSNCHFLTVRDRVCKYQKRKQFSNVGLSWSFIKWKIVHYYWFLTCISFNFNFCCFFHKKLFWIFDFWCNLNMW